MVVLHNVKQVEISMVTGQGVYGLGDQKVLNDRKIISIAFLKGGLTESGGTVQDPTSAYLHLKERNSNDKKLVIAGKALQYEGTYPVLARQPILPRVFNWEESELHIPTSALTNGNIIQIEVNYEDEKSL